MKGPVKITIPPKRLAEAAIKYLAPALADQTKDTKKQGA
jgi:hypothetical protein